MVKRQVNIIAYTVQSLHERVFFCLAPSFYSGESCGKLFLPTGIGIERIKQLLGWSYGVCHTQFDVSKLCTICGISNSHTVPILNFQRISSRFVESVRGRSAHCLVTIFRNNPVTIYLDSELEVIAFRSSCLPIEGKYTARFFNFYLHRRISESIILRERIQHDIWPAFYSYHTLWSNRFDRRCFLQGSLQLSRLFCQLQFCLRRVNTDLLVADHYHGAQPDG